MKRSSHNLTAVEPIGDIEGAITTLLRYIGEDPYIFVRDGATWKQTTYLKQSNLNHNQDAFGSAIALSGDGQTLVVDAADEDGTVGGINGPQYDGAQIGDHSNGALYVFVNTNGTWSQQAYIKSSNVRVNDLFGIRLAVSTNGNVLVASSMLQGGGGRGVTANQQDFSAEESGAVYVFTRAGTTWTQRAYLKSPNSDAYDEFGSGVAMRSPITSSTSWPNSICSVGCAAAMRARKSSATLSDERRWLFLSRRT